MSLDIFRQIVLSKASQFYDNSDYELGVPDDILYSSGFFLYVLYIYLNIYKICNRKTLQLC